MRRCEEGGGGGGGGIEDKEVGTTCSYGNNGNGV